MMCRRDRAQPVRHRNAWWPSAVLLAVLGAPSPQAFALPRLAFYETRSIVLSYEQVAALTEEPYWRTRLSRETRLTLIQQADAAAASSLEPLFAAVVSWLPKAPADTPEWVFVVQAQGAQGGRVALRPAPQRPEMDLQPFAVDAVSSVEADAQPGDWRPKVSFRHAGFPGGIDAWCAAHASTCAALFSAGEERKQTLLTVDASGSQASFLVDRTAAKTAAQTGPTVRYLGDTGVTGLPVPADFEQRDITDLSVDPATIRGIENLERAERIAVKSAITSYQQSGTHSAEADVVLPVGPSGEARLYTLRFQPQSEEVTVEALGAAADLLPADGPRSEVRRIRGYPAGADGAQVQAWLRKRYPGLTVKGRTPDEMARNADRTIDRLSTTPAWFSANYDLSVLDAKAGDRRLAQMHGRAVHQRGGLRAFTAPELRALEAVLQRLDRPGLAALRGTALVRQRAAEEASPFGDLTARVQISGHTFTRTAAAQPGEQHRQVDATIVIYDAAHAPHRFIGGRTPDGLLRAYPPVAEVIAHELAHVITARAPVQEQFDALVQATGAAPFTRYAASDPASEFLPEAFALYLLDPAWVNDNHPQLYARVQAYLRRPRPGAL